MNNTCAREHASPRRAARGMSLIELMISLLIASIVTLAIFAVMSTFEGRKRTTTSVNDANQAGNYAMHLLDKVVRSAGSGYVQAGPPPNPDNTDRVAFAFGCRLLVASGATTVLPRGSALPSPFEQVNVGTPGTLRLAPVIVAPSQSHGTGFNGERSDVLLVMAGAAGFGEVPLTLSGPIAANDMPVVNAVSPIGLTGTYSPTTVAGVSRAIYDDKSVAIKLGHPTTNPPNFLAVGVDDNTTLMSYDLLQTRSPTLQAVADNVYELHAVYGVDDNDDGSVNTWVDPRTTTGPFALTTLMNGTAVSAESIAQIKAIRIALILRSNLQEKAADASATPFTPATITLFQSVGLDRTRNLSADERRYRYRVIETTIPVRNALLAPSF
jgi:type IV pilus assembly protein PilW